MADQATKTTGRSLRLPRQARWVPLLLGSACLFWVIRPLLGENFHEIVPGQVYRTSQPSGSDVDRYVRDHGIRTIVNLRGVGEPAPWHREEAEATQRNRISQEDLTFSAGQLPSIHEVRKLVEVIERSEKPLLFHCFRGCDRTGLASTVAHILLRDAPLEEALEQLGWQYGHYPLGQTIYIDRFFDLYKEWLAEQNRAHTRERFRHWILHEYRPGACCCDLTLLDEIELPLRLRAGEPHVLHVRARNTSLRPWHFSTTQRAGFHLYWELFQEGAIAEQDRAGLLNRTVRPGESIDLEVVLPPLEPGAFVLQIDMLEEAHCFFRHTGSEPLQLPVRVRRK